MPAEHPSGYRKKKIQQSVEYIASGMEMRGWSISEEIYTATLGIARTVQESSGTKLSNKQIRNLLDCRDRLEFNAKIAQLPKKLFGF